MSQYLTLSRFLWFFIYLVFYKSNGSKRIGKKISVTCACDQDEVNVWRDGWKIRWRKPVSLNGCLEQRCLPTWGAHLTLLQKREIHHLLQPIELLLDLFLRGQALPHSLSIMFLTPITVHFTSRIMFVHFHISVVVFKNRFSFFDHIRKPVLFLNLSAFVKVLLKNQDTTNMNFQTEVTNHHTQIFIRNFWEFVLQPLDSFNYFEAVTGLRGQKEEVLVRLVSLGKSLLRALSSLLPREGHQCWQNAKARLLHGDSDCLGRFWTIS